MLTAVRCAQITFAANGTIVSDQAYKQLAGDLMVGIAVEPGGTPDNFNIWV
jgi:hypothetical protein